MLILLKISSVLIILTGTLNIFSWRFFWVSQLLILKLRFPSFLFILKIGFISIKREWVSDGLDIGSGWFFFWLLKCLGRIPRFLHQPVLLRLCLYLEWHLPGIGAMQVTHSQQTHSLCLVPELWLIDHVSLISRIAWVVLEWLLFSHVIEFASTLISSNYSCLLH